MNAAKEGPQKLLNNQVSHYFTPPLILRLHTYMIKYIEISLIDYWDMFLCLSQGQEDTSEITKTSPSQSSQKQGSGSNASSTNLMTNKIVSDEDQSEEWRKLLEAADKKVMQLMRRDYGGFKKPRRKPPINNNEPRNWLNEANSDMVIGVL